MTLETADTTTIQEALDMYVRSLRSGSKSKAKAGKNDKPIDHNALHQFCNYFSKMERDDEGKDRIVSIPIRNLTPADIGAYAESVNGTGTSPKANEHLQSVKDFLSYASKGLNWKVNDRNPANFVRIRKPRTRADATVISSESQPIELTSEGHTQLVQQRNRLVAESEALVEEIRRARADGDVTENSPLDAAREEQGRVEARIQEITVTLERSVILEEGQARNNKVVKIGARVEVKDLNSSRDPQVYTLVNKTEANPLEYRISDDSPMGKALLGKRVGQKLLVETPRGKQNYEVISIA